MDTSDFQTEIMLIGDFSTELLTNQNIGRGLLNPTTRTSDQSESRYAPNSRNISRVFKVKHSIESRYWAPCSPGMSYLARAIAHTRSV